MTERTFDLLAEAALCAWEGMLDLRDILPPLKATWGTAGTVEMRHKAIALAPVICDVYDALGTEWIEKHELLSYDWDFVPALLKLIDWDNLPTAEQLVQAMKAQYDVIR